MPVNTCLAIRRMGLTVVLLVFTVGATARADTNAEKWKFTITPYLWAIALNGDVALGQRTADLDVGASDLIDNLNFALMGEGEATKGRWTLYLDGVYADLAGDDTAVMDSRFVDVSVAAEVTSKLGIVGGGVMYRLGEWPLRSNGGKGGSASGDTWSLEALAGVRYTDLEVQTQVSSSFALGPGQSSSVRQQDRSVDWVDPIVGLRTQFHLGEKWDLLLRGDIGGFGVGSEFTWNAFGGAAYRFHRGMRVVFGYRGLYQDYKTGSGADFFAWDMTLHGPLVGVSFSF